MAKNNKNNNSNKNRSSTRNNSKLLKSNSMIEILILVLIIIIIIIVIHNNKKSKDKFDNTSNNKAKNNRNTKEINNKNDNKNDNKTNNKSNNNEQVVRVVVENNTNNKSNSNNDHSLSFFQYQKSKAFERVINPLLPPERSYENTYGIPINIPSRGDVGSFQQIGALYKESVESENQKSGNNSDSIVLALYGKTTYPGSRKWTYYTSSADSHHQVKMPITHKGKKCDSQYGCDEIENDELITIPGYNGIFRVVIYDFDVPKYLPCV